MAKNYTGMLSMKIKRHGTAMENVTTPEKNRELVL